MTPEHLITAVRAALDVRERIALAAGGEGWNAHGEAHAMRRVTVNYSTDCVVAATLAPRGVHIAANDPATVLRLIRADRRVLQRHQPMECGNRSPAHSAQHIVCAYDCDGDWPCPDFRDLAHGLGIDPEETEDK